MTPPDAALCALLDRHGIAHARFDHPAVFTCEEAARLVPPEAAGIHTKNLFLRDRRGRRHWLLVTTCAKAVDLKALAGVAGADALGLASPARLADHLGVTPGAVTLLALIHDRDRRVELLLDRDVWTGEPLRCHPLVNTATLVVPRDAVERFLAVTGHAPRVVEVPARAAPAPGGPA
jgi:Ala-tRNA(Pro) deacylase